MAYRKKKSQTKEIQTSRTTRETRPPVVTVDYDKYLHHLENADASVEEKIAYINMLAEILIGFVDLGFGVHPVQQAQSPCGKDKEISLKPTLTAPDAIYLHHKHLAKKFEDAADLETDMMVEGV